MNLKKNRLYEGTPLDQRDEVAAFQAQRDKEEATPAAEKFGDELHKRNEKYLEVWRDFIDRLDDVTDDHFGSAYGYSPDYYHLVGGECLESGDPYIPATGYFDSSSFSTGSEAVGSDPAEEGAAIYLYHLKDDCGTEAGGVDFDEFIARVKRDGGLELLLGGFWAVDEDDDDYNRIIRTRGDDYDFIDPEFSKVVNAHVKCLLNKGISRKDVAKEVQFLNNVDKKDFPGCARLDIEGENGGRLIPTILVWYKLSPLPTKEEMNNVVKGLSTLLDHMCFLGNLKEYFG